MSPEKKIDIGAIRQQLQQDKDMGIITPNEAIAIEGSFLNEEPITLEQLRNAQGKDENKK